MAGSGIVDSELSLTSFDIGSGGTTGGNYEDLLDFITILSPTETPLLSGLGKTVARDTRHYVLLDSLESYGDPDVGAPDVSVTPEGQDASFQALANRKRISNLTHILRETVDVTDTQRAVNTVGMADEFAYQLRKKMKLLALKIEFALIHSQWNAQTVIGNIGGTPAEGRMMEGVLNYIEPDPATVGTDYLTSSEEGTITECGSPFARLTETVFNDHMQAGWAKGVTYKTAYTQAVQKREISGFTTNVTRNIQAASLRQINSIDVYQGDFGTIAIMLHRMIPTREVLTMDEDYSKVAVLRPILATELPKMGNSTRAMIEAELTLEVRAPAANGKIIWGSSTFGSAT